MTAIGVSRGDLTKTNCDVLVNAANSGLLGGGGVDGAIHRVGGPEIMRECEEIRATRYPQGLPAGQAVSTKAGALPAKWVVHTGGPMLWEHVGGGADLLADCHRNALAIADQLGATSIAFPAISCGVYGWSATDAALEAFEAALLRALGRHRGGGSNSGLGV